jgi:GTP pyrophosphokinase
MTTEQAAQEILLPKYNLTEEQEKRLILRQYRALLKVLGTEIKKGRRRTNQARIRNISGRA